MAAAQVFHFRDSGCASACANARASAGGGDGGNVNISTITTYAGGWQELGARTPARFRERLIDLFRSPRNIEYLRTLFARRVPPGPLRCFALDTLEDSVYAYERVEDLILSDPIAQRGDARPAANFWAELRRLNLAFYEYRMQFLRDKAALISGKSQDNQWDDDEQYHYRMFVADSLRPPGLEHLNGTGPLYGIQEDQTVTPKPRAPPGVITGPNGQPRLEGFTSAGLQRARVSADAAPVHDPGVDPDDWGWDGGDPNRTPEQALAEYWGEDRAETDTSMTSLGATEVGGEAYIDRYGQGDQWRENGGTRFMRYPTIPIWQNLSRGRNYDRDIDETLGTGDRELDNHVRRWDMERMRNPRGEEYRRYGWRD